jgi:hypothetical protein
VQKDLAVVATSRARKDLGLAVEDEFDQFVALIEAHG